MTDTTDYQLTDTATGSSYAIPAGSTSTLGRDAACEIQLLNSSVSRQHARIEHSGNEIRFSDLGSSNGSMVNGAPAQGAVLVQHGDTLRLGDVELRLSAVGATVGAEADGDMTVIGGGSSGGEAAIPSTWADQSGLESASQTQFAMPGGASTDSAADVLSKLGPATSPRLVVVGGELAGNVFELGGVAAAGESRSWKIGRADECDIQLAEASVSGQHAQLVNEGERWKVVNWMSTNGTIVNGRKSLSTYLQNEDRITLGATELMFQLPQDTAQTVRSAPVAPAAKPQKKPGFFSRLFGGKD